MTKSSTHVECLCEAMMKRFGGIDGFAGAWMDHIAAATKRYPGSRTVGTTFQSLARMLEERDRLEDEAAAASKQACSRMSEAELLSAIEMDRDQFIRAGHTAEEFDALMADVSAEPFDSIH